MLAAAGGAVATGVEYGMALFYERVLRVSFWNYEGLPGSIQGRVCIPFALAWSLLMLPLVYLVHPAAARLAAAIPDPVSWAVLAALLGIWPSPAGSSEGPGNAPACNGTAAGRAASFWAGSCPKRAGFFVSALKCDCFDF